MPKLLKSKHLKQIGLRQIGLRQIGILLLTASLAACSQTDVQGLSQTSQVSQQAAILSAAFTTSSTWD
ncbi:hypothetical protein, partial [Deinococcus roseus]